MKHKMSTYSFLIILGLLSLTSSCNLPSNINFDTTTPTVFQDTNKDKEPTLTQKTTSTNDLTANKTPIPTQTPFQPRSETLTHTSPYPTSTPTLTNIAKSQEPSQDIPFLQFCNQSKSDVCIGSFLPMSGKLGMVFLKPNNEDECYILFDNDQFDCAAVVGFSDRYFCPGLPGNYNRTYPIQIFLVGSFNSSGSWRYLCSAVTT